MAVLVACEESQVVTTQLRLKGIEAYSCDLLPTSGNFPEWHIQGDCIELLQHNWTGVVAFPPCTDLCSSGARWWKQKREEGRQQSSIDFFLQFTRLACPFAIENPIGLMSNTYRKPDQIIQPWQFGHGETKATCLWLSKLPLLQPTNIVDGREQRIHKMPPSINRSLLRSKTYLGIAEAMAEQWSTHLQR